MIIFGSLGGALHKDVCNMSSGGLWPASCSSLCLSINAFMKQLLASIFQFENCTFVLQLVFQKKTAMQKGRMCFLQTEFFFFFWLQQHGRDQFPLPSAGCLTSWLISADFSVLLRFHVISVGLFARSSLYKVSYSQGGSILYSLTHHKAVAFFSYKKALKKVFELKPP